MENTNHKTPTISIQEALKNRLGISPKEFSQLTGISLISVYRHLPDIPHVEIGARKIIKHSYIKEILGGNL